MLGLLETTVSSQTTVIGEVDWERLGRIAHRALRLSPYSVVRGLTCICRNGAVTISGSVPSYYMKQLAQVAIRRVLGSCTIDNQVEVSDQCSSGTTDRHGFLGQAKEDE